MYKRQGEIVAVGTMALRTAKNAKDFIDAVRDLSGIEVRVIPGEEEAEFAYLAVLSGIGASVERLAVCDVGGGSTEFIFGGQAGIDRRFSINLGAVKVSADYLSSDPPSSKEVEDAISYVLDVLKENGVNCLLYTSPSYEYDEFLEEIVKPHPDLMAVDVSKHRQGLIINECITEFALTEFNSVPFQTICVEHEDPALVMETVRKLGLESCLLYTSSIL